jgi:hypothetical protein
MTYLDDLTDEEVQRKKKRRAKRQNLILSGMMAYAEAGGVDRVLLAENGDFLLTEDGFNLAMQTSDATFGAIALSASSVSENASVATAVGIFSVSPSNGSGPYAWSLVNTDGGKFGLGASATLVTAAALDYETSATHVVVAACDGARTATFTISVIDVEDSLALSSIRMSGVWPGFLQGVSGAPALGSASTLDAAGEYSAWVFCARETMAVSHIGFRPGTVVAAPTAIVSIQQVAADGTIDGTLWAANTDATTATLVSNTWALTALTATANITAGQRFAVVITYASGTSLITQVVSGINNNELSTPYFITNTTGSPVKSRSAGAANIALGSSTTEFYELEGALPATAVTNSAFNNTNGAARGMRFSVPFGCRCIGLRVWFSNSIGDFNYGLYDANGTELGNSITAYDGDHNAVSAAGTEYLYFDNAVELTPGVEYRALITPTSATNTTFGFLTLSSSDYRSAMPGGKHTQYITFASSAFDLTQTDKVGLIDILFDQLQAQSHTPLFF